MCSSSLLLSFFSDGHFFSRNTYSFSDCRLGAQSPKKGDFKPPHDHLSWPVKLICCPLSRCTSKTFPIQSGQNLHTNITVMQSADAKSDVVASRPWGTCAVMQSWSVDSKIHWNFIHYWPNSPRHVTCMHNITHPWCALSRACLIYPFLYFSFFFLLLSYSSSVSHSVFLVYISSVALVFSHWCQLPSMVCALTCIYFT